MSPPKNKIITFVKKLLLSLSFFYPVDQTTYYFISAPWQPVSVFHPLLELDKSILYWDFDTKNINLKGVPLWVLTYKLRSDKMKRIGIETLARYY